MAKKDESKAIDKAPQAGAVVERDPADASTYRILNRTEEELNKTMEVFHHNLRGQKLTELNLPRAKVPPQGMTIWTLPGAEGDIHAEEITGILVEYTTPRAYWDKPLEPGNVTPPVCSSPDGIRGTGDPGGLCHLCPMSKYGSNPREGSNGQACSEKRMLLLLRPDSILPLVVQAPSTSIRNVFDYTMHLANDQGDGLPPRLHPTDAGEGGRRRRRVLQGQPEEPGAGGRGIHPADRGLPGLLHQAAGHPADRRGGGRRQHHRRGRQRGGPQRGEPRRRGNPTGRTPTGRTPPERNPTRRKTTRETPTRRQPQGLTHRARPSRDEQKKPGEPGERSGSSPPRAGETEG